MENITNESLHKLLKIDKIINDLLEILATLDGRVRKLEIKLHIKKQKSYLKLVASPDIEEKVVRTLVGEIREAQEIYTIDLLRVAIEKMTERLDYLEHQI